MDNTSGNKALVRIRGAHKVYFRGAERLDILNGIDLEVPPDTPFNVDGEVCRVAPARFSARGERVRVVCRP